MAYGVRWEWHRDMECQFEALARVREDAPYGYLYRFEDCSYATMRNAYDGDDEWVSTGPILELEAFAIRSVTPQGFTIHASNGHGWRFISHLTRKKFALPTIEAALESYIARKEKQASIYENKAKQARQMIAAAQLGGFDAPR